VLLSLVLGCKDKDPVDKHTDPPLSTIEAFTEAVEKDGNTVAEGFLTFANYEGCCDPDITCFGNNPDTPYGTYAIPRIHGEEPVDDVFTTWGELEDPTQTRTYRLREDEALVFIGQTPPAARYLSIRSYLPLRPEPDGSLKTVLASLGPSLNNLVIADRSSAEEMWDQPLVVVTTADASVERRMHELLEEAGFDADSIHDDRITHEVVNMGLDADADTFFMLWRVAMDDDPAAGQAFRDNPEGAVFRVTPKEERPAQEPHPWPDLLPLGTGSGEEAWQDAADALEAAIVAAYPESAPIILAGQTVEYPRTLECIEEEDGCKTDLRDRYSALAPYFSLDLDTDFAVVFGVNHARTGKAMYANFALIDEAHQFGFAGVNSDEMVGSARHYLPDEPLVDDLYAYMVTRDCSGRAEPCIEVPTTCPGVPIGDQMRLTFRAYLEPATGAAPLPAELVPDKIARFWAL